MKDSGIPWFGKISKGWTIEKIKFNYEISTGKVLQSKKNNDNEILINFITAGNVFWNNVDLNDLPKMWATQEQIRKLRLKENDLLICEGGEAGRSAILTGLKIDCILQNHVHRLRSKNYFLNKFLMYVLKYFDDIGLLQTIVEKVTLSSLSTSTLGNIPIPLPKIDDELEQIVLYLDKKIKSIDNEITKNQSLIKLLQEKKQSKITHAVTKGLNDSVPTRDSGIEWIGDIPKHWQNNKLKRVLTLLKDGTHNPPPRLNEGILLLSSENIRDGYIDYDNNLSHISEKDHAEIQKTYKIQKGDILLTIVGTIGRSSIVKEDIIFSVQRSVAILRTIKKVNSEFMHYVTKGNHFKNQLSIKVNKTVQGGIYLGELKNIPIVFPKIDEQEKIVQFLDKEIGKIDSLLSKIESQITKLKEFKESLISSAVTGKIKVTQA